MPEAKDLTKSPPRRGRELLGGYAWLARVADIARAQHAGTNGKYEPYDQLTMEWLDKLVLSKSHFNAVVQMGADDDFLVMFLNRHVDMARQGTVNRFILEDHRTVLDQQDAEEGYA